MKQNNLLENLKRELVLFIIGGFIYYMIEVIGRGWSHWTMFVVGGLCFVIIGLINEWYTWNMSFLLQTGIGAFVITALEFVSGYFLNIKLQWYIWDYSDRPFNLAGQICLFNCLYWVILSAVAIVLDDVIRWKFMGEEKPRYILIKKKLL